MRLLLLLMVLLASACVTERGARRPLEAKTLSSRCEAGPVTATLDPSVRDRVHLIFSASERCEAQVEQTYQVEQRRRIPVWLRVVFAVPAAATVAVPVWIGLAVLGDKPGVDLSGGRDSLGWAILAPALLVGAGTFAALSANELTTSIESERLEKKTTRALHDPHLKGVVTWLGAPGPPRELSDGSLSLTLLEAVGLESGAITLDGAPVSLSPDTRDRLGFLSACADSVRGFDPRTAGEQPFDARVARLKRAELCEWNGWAFAEVEQVIKSSPGVTNDPVRLER